MSGAAPFFNLLMLFYCLLRFVCLSCPLMFGIFYTILSHNIGRLSGTTDKFATIPFYLVLFLAALVDLAKSIPVPSLILSSYLFFYRPLFLFPFTVPCRIVFTKPEGLETWPNHLSFRFFIRSGLRHILHWLLGFFRISFQKPAFFSLAQQSRSKIHRHTEIWK